MLFIIVLYNTSQSSLFLKIIPLGNTSISIPNTFRN